MTSEGNNSQLMALRKKELEDYFHFLSSSFHQNFLSLNELESELDAMLVYDLDGVAWTIGAKTGKWYFLDGDTWRAGEPREPLFSVSQVYETLFAGKTVCSRCGEIIENSCQYCPDCGADMSQIKSGSSAGDKASHEPTFKPSFCRKCGNPLVSQSRFCNKCGAGRS